MRNKCYLNANNYFVDFEKEVINGKGLEKYVLKLHLTLIFKGIKLSLSLKKSHL
jgi:hypothetical protein